jgi:hypothetical protein
VEWPDARLWDPQPEHAKSPEGRLLTWYSTLDDGSVSPFMYPLRRRSLTDAEGEALRIERGGTTH